MKKQIAILIAVFLLLAVPALLLNTRQGVNLSDMFFARQDAHTFCADSANEFRLRAEEGGTHADILLRGKPDTAFIAWSDELTRVVFGDGEVIEGCLSETFGLVDANGRPLWMDDRISIVVGGEGDGHISRVSIAEALCRMDLGETESRGSVWLIVLGAAFYGFGMLNILLPEKMFFFGSCWQFAHAELSDAGYAAQVFGGYVSLIGGAVFMYLPLFL